MTYSAVSAKIRAMQGRFLTDTDFSQLAFSDSVSAAVETLKSRPSYSCAFEAAGGRRTGAEPDRRFYGSPFTGTIPAFTGSPP